MLSIGEFSRIAHVSTKTLRYYAEIGLIQPSEINPENGYRYYAIEQLKTMLFINRLKSYQFSLEEIKDLLHHGFYDDKEVQLALIAKERQLRQTLDQIQYDVRQIQCGQDIMDYVEDIELQLVEVPQLHILSHRAFYSMEQCVQGFLPEYQQLFERIEHECLTIAGAPMMIYHSIGYSESGYDMELGIPIKEIVSGTRDITFGLCLKTVLQGSYAGIQDVYTKQWEYMKQEGYQSRGTPFEVYVTHPEEINDDSESITEIYHPVKKRRSE